jgi:hypothetical protein
MGRRRFRFRAVLGTALALLTVGAVLGLGPAVDGPDLAQQPDVLAVALGGIALLGQPAVEGRDRDLQHPEDGLDPEAGTMLGYEPHDRRRVGSSSWAK